MNLKNINTGKPFFPGGPMGPWNITKKNERKKLKKQKKKGEKKEKKLREKYKEKKLAKIKMLSEDKYFFLFRVCGGAEYKMCFKMQKNKK